MILSYGELSTSMQTLMRQGAELDPNFDAGAEAYYQAVLANDALTNADGNAPGPRCAGTWTTCVSRMRPPRPPKRLPKPSAQPKRLPKPSAQPRRPLSRACG